jgi:hypothetical protein
MQQELKRKTGRRVHSAMTERAWSALLAAITVWLAVAVCT